MYTENLYIFIANSFIQNCSAQDECPPDSERSKLVTEEPSILERSIRNLREGFTDIYGKFQQQKGVLDDKINEGTQSVKCK